MFVKDKDMNYWIGTNYRQNAFFKIDMGQPVQFKQFQITNANNDGSGYGWRSTKDLAIDVSICPYNWTRVAQVTLPKEIHKACHELTKTLVDVDIIGRYIKVYIAKLL